MQQEFEPLDSPATKRQALYIVWYVGFGFLFWDDMSFSQGEYSWWLIGIWLLSPPAISKSFEFLKKSPLASERNLVIGGETLAGLALLFPPWRQLQSHYDWGFASIFDPPNASAAIDISRLLIELAVIGVLLSLCLYLRRQYAGSDY